MTTFKFIQSLKLNNLSSESTIHFWRQSLPYLLTCNKCSALQQVRFYHRPPEKKGLIGRFIDNIKDGMKYDKQMQDKLKKFQGEAKKFDESETVKEAKIRLSSVNRLKETVSPYMKQFEGAMKDSANSMSSTVEQMYKEAKSSDIFKKSEEVTRELSKAAHEAASHISKHSDEIEKTKSFKTASEALSKVREDLLDDMVKHSRPYQRPEQLKRRSDKKDKNEKKVAPNENAQNVVLHKDSMWQQQWKDFRDNNTVVNGLFSLKTKYDESDNVVIRASRVVTDKLTDIFADVFSQSEQAATIAEITKIDPSFNKELFIKECEFEIIPTILEAYMRGDMDCLKDWCHEGVFNILSTQIQQNNSMGLVNESKVLDIREVDLVLAKILEQGPVLIISFLAQQLSLVRNSRGDIVEGGEGQIENVNYIIAMCRDQSIFEHHSAWRVLELGIQQSTPYI